ncbi:hypothetical protein [Streptomyces canus]|uniref:hypothetical protein n=1 Tax=Streptomyces canus TaxID=58343 RepID=UPI00277DD64B|nr:hypothetical protein [Streptomyces canus]MDQ0757553.1 hypothetical protein [Streptomyces canus]MDQ1073748.1 hypothetical protein [Streptomyces canus]
MVTINEVLAALTELRSDLETHAWQPDEHEHASQDGRELRLAPDDVLDLGVRATGDQLQIVGTESQGDTVTSPPGRRFTS